MVGVNNASPNVIPNSSLYSLKFSSFTLNIFLTKENPFEWTPEDVSPITTSPSCMLSGLIIFDLSTTPTLNPAKSYSLSEYSPGISAVSPPTNAHPAFLQPSATPFTILATISGMFFHNDI